MRIAYVLHWAGEPGSGVIKKVVSQTWLWKSAGHEICVFLAVPESSRQAVCTALSRSDGMQITSFGYRGKFSRLGVWSRLPEALTSFRPHCVYLRHDLSSRGLLPAVRRFPTVGEVNTNDVVETKLMGKVRCLYHLITRKALLRALRGVCFVTKELSEAPEFRQFEKPSVVIANGIDLRTFDVLPPAQNPQPRFVFVGSGDQSWQGVDEIMNLASSKPGWHFDVVGIRDRDLGLAHGSNVRLLPHSDRSRYQSIMAESHIAISTLALYRKGMTEACALKTREYLASGLATIIGYRDTDFPNPTDFLLQIPNEPGALLRNASVVERFAHDWGRRRVERSCISHLDIAVKETRRLEFMKTFVE